MANGNSETRARGNPGVTNRVPKQPSLAQALRFWWKFGWISFGGPAGQIAILHQELVERQAWVSEASFLHALNFCMLLPGPEAQQLATYLGWLMHRTLGGVLAGLLFILPSLLILTALSWVYLALGELPAIGGMFRGIQPVVVAIVALAIQRMARKALKTPLAWTIAAASFGGSYLLGLPFPVLVAAAALAGWLGGRAPRRPASAAAPASQAQRPARAQAGKAPAEDAQPTAATGANAALQQAGAELAAPTRFSLSRLAAVCAVFALLWLLPMGALVWHGGWESTLTQMGRFFTQVALLTFGGAYAVLPYVLDGAVHHYAWLSAPQMIDGLALGETTPGPLIMVVAFVGFVGAHTHAVLGPEHLWLGAALGACVVTWFTFLPSFFFILAGGPWVESTRENPGVASALAGVTAAVVGAMLQMGVYFAAHVLWPGAQPGAPLTGTLTGTPLNWPAAGVMVLAAVALQRGRSVLEVLGAGALLGLAAGLL